MNESNDPLDVPIEKYFKARPVALNIALALITEPKGMTISQIAKQLNSSVQTVDQLTEEMRQLGFLISKGKGKKQLFQVVSGLSDRIFEMSPELWQEIKNDSVESRLFAAKTLVDELKIPLTTRYAGNILRKTLKRRVRQILPEGIRSKRPHLQILYGETPSFDMIFGNDTTDVAVELKILNSPRNVREAIGSVASLASQDIGLQAIIPVFLLLPVQVRGIETGPVDPEEILDILSPLSGDAVGIDPIVERVELNDLSSSSFAESLARRIVDRLQEIIKKEPNQGQ
jgi:predicted transcriptional regulator